MFIGETSADLSIQITRCSAQLLPLFYEKVLFSSISEIIESDADAAVIPFENSLGGWVGKSIDLLREKDIEVTGEHTVDIDHVLVSNEEGISEIERYFDTEVIQNKNKFYVSNWAVIRFFSTFYRYDPKFPEYKDEEINQLDKKALDFELGFTNHLS